MAGVAAEQFRGFALAPESSFKTPGAWVNPKAYRSALPNPGREQVAWEGDLNSYGDREPGTPGMQTFDFGVDLDFHGGTYTDLVDVLTGILGEEDAGGAMTQGGGGTNDVSNVAYSAGDPSAIFRVTDDNGDKWILPGRHTAAASVALDVNLPAGLSAEDIDNPSELQGGCFNYVLGDSADTFSVEFDWRARPTEIVHRGKGCVFTEAGFLYEEGKRLGLSLKGKAAEWTKAAGPSAVISDPGRATDFFLSRMSDFYLSAQASNLAADAANGANSRIRKLSFNMAPPVIDERASQGLNGADALPGTDIYGYTREPIFPELLRMTVLYPDEGWYDVYDDQTAYKLFAIFYPGTPANLAGTAVPSKRIAIYFPELILDEIPKVVTDGGHRCMELAWRPRRRLTTGNNVGLFHLAFFNSL